MLHRALFDVLTMYMRTYRTREKVQAKKRNEVKSVRCGRLHTLAGNFIFLRRAIASAICSFVFLWKELRKKWSLLSNLLRLLEIITSIIHFCCFTTLLYCVHSLFVWIFPLLTLTLPNPVKQPVSKFYLKSYVRCRLFRSSNFI